MRGFTLVEVVVALLVLEIGVLAAVATLTVATRQLGRAERLERAVASAEGVLDSLAGAPAAGPGNAVAGGGRIEWTFAADGELELRSLDLQGQVLFTILGVIPRP